MKTVADTIETLSAVLDVQVEEPGVEVGSGPWRRGELDMLHCFWPGSCPSSIALGQH